MRVLCDVHIPYRLVNFLRERGVDATHVNRILDKSYTKDAEIVRYVDETGSFLITKDADFRDSHFITGKPARVVRVALGNLSNDQLIALFDHHWTALRSIFEEARCYVEIGTGGPRVFNLHRDPDI